MTQIVSQNEIDLIIGTNHHDPYQVLGAHECEQEGKKIVAVRAFLPDAVKAEVIDLNTGTAFKMEKLHDAGFFESVITERTEVFPYRIKSYYENGASAEFYDSYAFMPTVGEMDQYYFSQGNHHELYEKLGAHIRYFDYFKDKLGGVSFAVWAPNARRVSVIGDFNRWDGRRHVMRSLGTSGVWEIFIPGLQTGQNYKFEIKTKDGALLEKCDPFAFYAEVRPKTASKIYDLSGYNWEDGEWMNWF